MNNSVMTKKISLSIFIITFAVIIYAAEDVIVFDSVFFKKFSSVHPIKKDIVFENMLNKQVIGRGIIRSVSLYKRYKKKYRIIIESAESSRYNHKVLYYVFLEDKNTTDILDLNSKFEFKGHLIGYTPLGTKRNEYILDIIFIEGSTIIE